LPQFDLRCQLGAQEKNVVDNPATKKLNRDVGRHQDFLKRIAPNQGAGHVIFLGDSITHGWEGQPAWQTPHRPLVRRPLPPSFRWPPDMRLHPMMQRSIVVLSILLLVPQCGS
jgi:hypothetical protein